MPSINDVSIALNSLFLDIQNPITLGLNKAEFFKTFREVSFRFSETDFFEFNVNPIFRFDTPEELLKFLEKERQLAENYSDYTNCEYINGLIHEKNCVVTLDVFFIEYSVVIDGSCVDIVFNTNSMIFKYEVIG